MGVIARSGIYLKYICVYVYMYMRATPLMYVCVETARGVCFQLTED